MKSDSERVEGLYSSRVCWWTGTGNESDMEVTAGSGFECELRDGWSLPGEETWGAGWRGGQGITVKSKCD